MPEVQATKAGERLSSKMESYDGSINDSRVRVNLEYQAYLEKKEAAENKIISEVGPTVFRLSDEYSRLKFHQLPMGQITYDPPEAVRNLAKQWSQHYANPNRKEK